MRGRVVATEARNRQGGHAHFFINELSDRCAGQIVDFKGRDLDAIRPSLLDATIDDHVAHECYVRIESQPVIACTGRI